MAGGGSLQPSMQQAFGQTFKDDVNGRSFILDTFFMRALPCMCIDSIAVPRSKVTLAGNP